MLLTSYINIVGAIMQIKSTYNIKQIWQGDPCSPKTEMWKGVNCSYNGHNQPRIISLYVVCTKPTTNSSLIT